MESVISLKERPMAGTASTGKATYRVTNWREYNESLVRRGDITLWLDEEVLQSWQHANGTCKVGRPYLYSDLAIEALLTLRELFRLPYRQTEGLGRALATLMQVAIPIPDFTSLQKRAAKLNIAITVSPTTRGPLHVVIDSSGVKVYGEGEWRVRCYGVERRRTWRKLHLAVDPQTQEIVAHLLTTKHVGDAGRVAPLLAQIERPIEKFYGDGGYDHWHVFQTLAQRQIEPVIALRKNASIQQHGNSASAPLPRDECLRQIRRYGRRGWKRRSGYHRRSLVETAFSRLKRRFGDTFKNRHLDHQQTEIALRCKLLNHFVALGMPKFVWSN
jgi:DDE family transposase